jgi:hypothetical protein
MDWPQIFDSTIKYFGSSDLARIENADQIKTLSQPIAYIGPIDWAWALMTR